MKKRLLIGLSSVLISSTLLANMAEDMPPMAKGMKAHGQHKNMQAPFAKGMIISKIMMLNLTKEQKEQIKEIINSFKDKLEDPYAAFSDTAFDKDKFIDAQRNNFKAMIKNRADLIQEVYSVLTKEQRKDLKTILDMETIMKKKNFDKMMNEPRKPEFRG